MQQTFNGDPDSKPTQPTSRVSAGLSSLAGATTSPGEATPNEQLNGPLKLKPHHRH
ncbi:hypothetical protein Pst134EA_004686 [Puccinia striiformis f. sp. tritici]|uniref:hypothetical protein n=1 Tax=Puccinia striiformis f. sp. tritici TaxID=168172 RepID=UPI002008AB7F|nr:hypothetical protein Pst134EA_004686 [Puccinia striiformis f. sp. tritici]KAH9470760.1 hypothetical protein Pst134EA_004686 [Puccinia striiformis f. sp. tritici]